jgi:hypothetical protein
MEAKERLTLLGASWRWLFPILASWLFARTFLGGCVKDRSKAPILFQVGKTTTQPPPKISNLKLSRELTAYHAAEKSGQGLNVAQHKGKKRLDKPSWRARSAHPRSPGTAFQQGWALGGLPLLVLVLTITKKK